MSNKNVLIVLALAFLTQCKLAESAKQKNNCAVASVTVTLPENNKTAKVSYYACEFVVFMPQSKDSAVVLQYLADIGCVLKAQDPLSPTLRLYERPKGTDGNPPPPKPKPSPFIEDRVRPNAVLLDINGRPTTLFNTLRTR